MTLQKNSNKWDATKYILLTQSRQDILLTQSCQDALAKHERVKNNFQKRKLEYWEPGIKEIRTEKRKRMN